MIIYIYEIYIYMMYIYIYMYMIYMIYIYIYTDILILDDMRPVGVLFLIIFGISLLTRDLNYLSKNLLKPLVELSDEVEPWRASDPVKLRYPTAVPSVGAVWHHQCLGLILCEFFQFLCLLCAA